MRAAVLLNIKKKFRLIKLAEYEQNAKYYKLSDIPI